MNMYKVEIKNMFKSLMVWTIVMACILVLFMSMFPSMANSGINEIVKAKIDAIPQGMRKSFGLEGGIDFSDLLQYFAYCDQYILIANCIYAVILGANSLIKEESEGTIEFLYAQPISRFKIVSVKMLSNLTVIFVFDLMLFIISVILFEILKQSGYKYVTQLVFIYKGMFLVQVVFLIVGFMLSTLIPKVSLATPTALGLFFTTYLFGIFSNVIDKLEWMKYFSPIEYVMPNQLLESKGAIESIYVFICLIVILAGSVFTFVRYKNKDLKI